MTVLKPGDLKTAQEKAGYDPLKDPAAPVQFQTLDEIKPWESVIMLYYGGSGVGKSCFVGTAGSRTLIINIGKGITPLLSGWARKKYYPDGSLPIVATISEVVNRKTGFFEKADAFDLVKRSIDWAMDHFPDRFDTIAVDDATALKAFAMNKGLELNEDFQRSKTKAAASKEMNFGSFVPAVQDYGAEMDLIDKFVADTVDFCRTERKHFLLTAHERFTYKKMKDPSGKVMGEEIDKTRPGFTGRTFPDEITAHFDCVWRAEALRTGGGMIYRAQTQDRMNIKAKTRYPEVFPDPVVEPNFLKAIDKIKKSGVS
jgi:hypothetical protein